jgi:hypothetical protein
MLGKKLIERIQNLKVGDFVTIYDSYGNNLERMHLHTSTVEKIGRDYVYVNKEKFTKKEGYGEYSRQLFPGPKNEFIEWFNNRSSLRILTSELSRYSDCLDYEDANVLKEILERVRP